MCSYLQYHMATDCWADRELCEDAGKHQNQANGFHVSWVKNERNKNEHTNEC